MSKKILAAVLAVMMVLSLAPMTAMAAGEGGTENGGSDTGEAATLQSKIDAASEATTIEVTGTVTESITISSGKDITLNFAEGAKLTNQDTTHTITVAAGGKLTIMGNGTIDNTSHQKAALQNNGTAILNGCTFMRSAEAGTNTTTPGGNSWYTIVNDAGTMTINAGVTVQPKIDGDTITGGYSSLIRNVNTKDVVDSTGEFIYARLTINGGTFTGGVNTVKNDDGGVLEVNDGTFKNTTQYVILNWNEAAIKNGTFTCTASGYGTIGNVSNSNPNLHSTGKLAISGGTLIAPDGVSVVETWSGQYNSKDITVSGGSFSSPVPVEYLDETLRYEAKAASGDAPYTYHVTSTEAEDAGTVTHVNRVTAGGFFWNWKGANAAASGLLKEDDYNGVTYPAILSTSAGKDALDQTMMIRVDNLKANTGYFFEILDKDGTEFDTDTFTTGAKQTNGVIRWSYATMAKADKPIPANSTLLLNLYEGASKEAGVLIGGSSIPTGLYTQPATNVEVSEDKKTVTLTIGDENTPGSGLLGDYTIDILKNDTSVLTTPYTFGADASKTDESGNADEKFGYEFTSFKSEAVDEGALRGGLYEVAVYVGRESGTTAAAPLFTIPFAVGTDVGTTEQPAGTTSFTLPSAEATEATFTLSNAYADGVTLKVYEDRELRTEIPAVWNSTAKTLKFNVVNPAVKSTYYVVATKTGKMPSKATAFTVNPYSNGGGSITGPSGGGTTTTPGTITTTSPANGTLTTNVSTAKEGDKVTVTVKPNEKYHVVTGVTVKGENGNITATKNADGTYSFTMPKGSVTVSATIAHMYDLFTDVPKDIAEYGTAIKWAVEQGITLGTSASTFSPYNACTRAQMVVFLYRAAGSPAITGTNKFTDLPSDSEIQKAVQWAVNNGITQGTSATTFAPNANCSRSEMVTFLHRYDKKPAVTGSNKFVDVPANAFYKDAVQWAVNKNITAGTNAEGTTFTPDRACTRGEMAIFLFRFLGK